MSRLLTQNSELRPLGIHNWTLPAWVVRLDDGRNVNVCPQAGACVKLCYARNGSYRFPGVQAAHQRNLKMVMDNLSDWTVAILDELNKPRFKPKGVPWLPDLDRSHLTPAVADLLDQGAPMIRIHDSGDFFSDEYLAAWVHIATLRPDILFYAYTKEVSRMRRVASDAPDNFLVCFSLGGREDHLLDLTEGRTGTLTSSRRNRTSRTQGTTRKRLTTSCASSPPRPGWASRPTTSSTSRSGRVARRSDRWRRKRTDTVERTC